MPLFALAPRIRVLGVDALRIVNRAFLDLFKQIRLLADGADLLDPNVPAAQQPNGLL